MTAVLPHDAAAERHVLGACLLGEYWQTVADSLTAQDFYEPRNQAIFTALSKLAANGAALDSVSLHDTLTASGSLERVGGDEYLLALQDTIPIPEHVERHCARIRELATLRAVHAVACAIAAEAADHVENIGDFLDRAEVAIATAGERRRRMSEPVHIREAFADTVEHLTAIAKSDGAIGHRTGLRKVDEYLHGAVPKRLLVAAGRPGMGKTAFALRVAKGVAESSKLPVAFFSLEMPKVELCMRLIAMETGIDGMDLQKVKLSRDNWDAITRAEFELSKLGLYVEDNAATTILDVRRASRKLKRRLGGLGLVVIDYLQLLRPLRHGRSREEEVSECSRLSKALAKELDVPVLALCQLNRDAEKRADHRPQKSDLRESGAIEQDADVILFLYRDEVYNGASEDHGIAEVNIDKHRQGITGTVALAFQAETTRFGNLLEHEERAWKARQEKQKPQGRRHDDV